MQGTNAANKQTAMGFLQQFISPTDVQVRLFMAKDYS
jgi:hypothetical protein